jgi:hypothetical protein
MKKAIVLLLALVLVGAFAFAQDAAADPVLAAPTYSLAANATGGWTMNLTQGTSNFINSYDFSFKYVLVGDVAKSKAGEGTYGQIDVTHLNLRLVEETESGPDGSALWTDKSPDDGFAVAAKIVSGPIEVGLYGAPGTNFENAKYVPLFNKDAGYATDSALKPALTGANGLTFKYSFGDLGSFSLKAASTAAVAEVAAGTNPTSVIVTGTGKEKDETAKGITYTTLTGAAATAPLTAGTLYIKTTAAAAKVDAVDPHYIVGGYVDLVPVKDLLTLGGGAWYDLDNKNMIATAKLGLTAGDLSASGALDFNAPDGGDSTFDIGANVTYKLFEAKDSVQFDMYYLSTDGAADKGDIGFKFVDAGGLSAPLSFTVGVFGDNLMEESSWLSYAVSGSYSVALSDTTSVKPYGAYWADLDGKGMYVNAGVEASLITNVLLTADFAMGGKNPDNNHVITDGKDAKDAVITLKAKVSL